MLKKLILVFSCLALAVASADTHRITLFQSSVLNGTELKPGDYKLEVTDSKVVISKGKESVQATATVENGTEKFNATSVRYSNGSGKYQIREIRIGGTKTKLVFAN
jgi:hypothetical protein